MKSFSYPGSDSYHPGGAWFICDVCSQRFRRAEMFSRWDNLRVDIKCLDPRPPQMTPPNVYPEGLPFVDARPPQDRPDRLEDDTTIAATIGGIYVLPVGQEYLGGQNNQPGGLSPLPVTNSIPFLPNDQEPGQPSNIGYPLSPNLLTDDETFISGAIPPFDGSNNNP